MEPLSRLLTAALLLALTPLSGARDLPLFTLHRGDLHGAFALYREESRRSGGHDFELLYEMCRLLLKQGSLSSDPEVKLLSCFGAGISKDELSLEILKEGFLSDFPLVQLIAFQALKELCHDEAEEILKTGLSSQNPLLRLETIYYYCKKNDPLGVDHAEILLSKVPPELKSLFPQFFAAAKTPASTRLLKKLLNDPCEPVRLAAIESLLENGRDDLLPDLRRMLLQLGPAQKEACAYALGQFRDGLSLKALERASCSKSGETSLTALFALYNLGQEERRRQIEGLALRGDLFAIRLLGQLPSEELLFNLMQSPNFQVRLNAALSLLERRDERCLPFLQELFSLDLGEWLFLEKRSLGGCLKAWQASPMERGRLLDAERSLHFLETLLERALLLSDSACRSLAEAILQHRQLPLIPRLMRFLESNPSSGALELLGRFSQQPGSPYIRTWCSLQLYKVYSARPFKRELIDWVEANMSQRMIGFRTYLPLSLRESGAAYELTPDQTSLLLVETLEAFARSRHKEEIEVLLHAIEQGHPKNRYALVGLLMRAIQ